MLLSMGTTISRKELFDVLVPFSRIVVLDSLLGPKTYPVMGSCPPLIVPGMGSISGSEPLIQSEN